MVGKKTERGPSRRLVAHSAHATVQVHPPQPQEGGGGGVTAVLIPKHRAGNKLGTTQACVQKGKAAGSKPDGEFL